MHTAPLAERLRPKKLHDLVGQQHLTGQGGILQKAIANDTGSNSNSMP